MKMNGWQRLGIVISAVWLLIGTFAYFHEISNHPSWLKGLPQLAYQWVQDNEFTQKAHQNARLEGKDFSNNYIFLKPTFSASGLLSFIFAPIIVSWVVVYLLIFIIRWVKNGFNT